MVFRRRRRPPFDAGAYDSIVGGLKAIYREKVRPLEEQYLVKDFHYPLLTDDDFDAKPMVLLMGSYSTGKTSFIRYLLEQEFPGMHVGPEPTTDGFQAIVYGAEPRSLPGNALVSSPAYPFAGLAQFGNAFLQRFQGCEVPSPFAKCCTLIDTPGVLAGKKQLDRSYSYESVIQWFAPRVDMILLMFDANKVDISDELKSVIQALEGFDDKIRIVLNKADSMDPAELLKINSALTWNLARILKAPEVRRIYVGSFWEQPLKPSFMSELFDREAHSLLADLATVPRNNTTAKLNDLVVRTRTVRVQALVLHELRSQMPKMSGRDRKQKELIASLEDVFYKVMKAHNISAGDFPDVNKFRHTLATSEVCRDFSKFKKMDDKLLAQLDAIIATDLGQLITEFESMPAPEGYVPPAPEAKAEPPPSQPNPSPPPAAITTALSAAPLTPSDPWAARPAAVESDPWAADAPARLSEAISGLFPAASPPPPAAAAATAAWAVSDADKAKYDTIFEQMGPEDGLVSGGKVAPVLRRSGLDNKTLRDVWALCDRKSAGALDADWFAVAMHLVMKVKRGSPLPSTMPEDCIPIKDR
ncbi:hypothetical protein AB1Y20_016082 [Prymnesium parvum]|uniref:Uncharacterized protein n=1 Tax=Prymnesium parvum TaxID=97485 RepID=A0AB34JYJ4_PRYPA